MLAFEPRQSILTFDAASIHAVSGRRVGTMKYLQLIVLLTVAAASTAVTKAESKVAPSQRSVERQLIELERQLSEALVKEDAPVLDRMWSNDLAFTFPIGK